MPWRWTPTPSSSAAQDACQQLSDALPDQVDGESSRPTSPSSSLTAAWGDPAITLTCGVPRPAALEPTAQLVTVNGVTWFPEQLTAGYRFTTIDRVANVQVDVPDDYAPEANVLTELSGPVKAANHRTSLGRDG